MTTQPANEFNLTGAPSEELRRKLLYLAMTDNGSVITGLRMPGGIAAESRREDEWTHHYVSLMMEMATAEEVRRLQDRLTLLDEASMGALLENEEKLRAAEQELERIHERAPLITMPDGSRVRVYRDSNVVRGEDGSLMDGMLPADLPEGTPELSEANAAVDRFDGLMIERQAIVAYRERLTDAQERLDQGVISQADLKDLETGLGDMPASVAAHHERLAPGRNGAPVLAADNGDRRAERTLDTPIQPTAAFSTVAPGISADDFADLPLAEPADNRNKLTGPSPDV